MCIDFEFKYNNNVKIQYKYKKNSCLHFEVPSFLQYITMGRLRCTLVDREGGTDILRLILSKYDESK